MDGGIIGAGAACFLLICLAECASSQGLYQLLASNGLTEFQKAVDTSFSVRSSLSAPSVPLALFAPTNEAIQRWRAQHSQSSINSDILQNHIAPGEWSQSKLIDIAQHPSQLQRSIASGYSSAPLWIKYFEGPATEPASIFVNNARIVSQAAIQVGSQVLFVVDQVIAPTGTSLNAAQFLDNPAAQMHSDLALDEIKRETEQLSEAAALRNSGSVFTFILPNNAALSALRDRGAFDGNVLKGHIIPNQVLFLRNFNDTLADTGGNAPGFATMLNGENSLKSLIGYTNATDEAQIFSQVENGDQRLVRGRVYANVVKANIPVQNGVIHVIDRVLLLMEQNARETIETRRRLFKFREWFNVIDPKFLEKLRTDHDFTLFVPTNKAIASLPSHKSEQLRKDKHFLEKIIQMHIVPRTLRTDEINNGTAVASLHGQRLTFKVRHPDGQPKEYFVDGGGVSAHILEPDLITTNAVIHVIGQVLGMPFMNVLEKLRADGSLHRTYKSVENSKDLNKALGSSGSNYTIFAPSNQAWGNMKAEDRDLLTSHPDLMAKVRDWFRGVGGDFESAALGRNDKDKFCAFTGAAETHRCRTAYGRRMGVHLKNGDRLTTMTDPVHVKQPQDSRDTLIEWKGHSAKLTTYDLSAINGVVHIIDQVLFDRETDSHSTSAAATLSLSFLLSVLLGYVLRYV